VYRSGGGDIYKIESASNLGWSGDLQPLILNNGPNICATIAPGVLPLANNQYAIYFGQTATNPGCVLDNQPVFKDGYGKDCPQHRQISGYRNTNDLLSRNPFDRRGWAGKTGGHPRHK
jgi:hypothetical protein